MVRSVRNDGQRNDLSSKNVHLPAVENVSKAPDIFFVVFDGYTSSDCLKEQFRYDNSGVDSALVRNGFFLSRKSKSNYSITPFSLSSTFTLDYLSPDVPERKSTSKSFLQAMHTFEQNNVVHYFQKLGYQIKNFGCFDLDGAPTQTIPYFDELPYNQINNQTLTGSINRDISFNWKIKNIFTGGLRVPGSYKQYKRYHLYRNSSNFDSLIAELGKGSDRPRFVYAHVMLPHEPFFLDSMGRQVSDTAMIKNTITFTDGYLAQLKYASSLIQRLIPYCASKEANRVVVIEGDHGFRDYGPETPRDRIFSNLNAYYFSDGDYRLLYDGISPVNTFRVILNKYFGAELPMLKDTSIFIPSPNQ